MHILTLSGRPGAGKSHTGRELVAKQGFLFLKSVTTRPPRIDKSGQVVEGEYVYVSNKEFEEMEENDEFLWTAEDPAQGYHYGTTKKSVTEALADERAPYVTILFWEKAAELFCHLKALGRESEVHLVFLSAHEDILRERVAKRDGLTPIAVERLKDSIPWPHQAINSKYPFRFVNSEGSPAETLDRVAQVFLRENNGKS